LIILTTLEPRVTSLVSELLFNVINIEKYKKLQI